MKQNEFGRGSAPVRRSGPPSMDERHAQPERRLPAELACAMPRRSCKRRWPCTTSFSNAAGDLLQRRRSCPTSSPTSAALTIARGSHLILEAGQIFPVFNSLPTRFTYRTTTSTTVPPIPDGVVPVKGKAVVDRPRNVLTMFLQVRVHQSEKAAMPSTPENSASTSAPNYTAAATHLRSTTSARRLLADRCRLSWEIATSAQLKT